MSDTPSLEFGFPPIADHNARILILGSMPSTKSLKQQQYYAHPRNTFWPIMCALFDIDANETYQKRCVLLRKNHIAIWDSLRACHRQGSLDQSIDSSSMITNDFNTFLNNLPNIEKILFNGSKAEQVFNRYALPTLNDQQLNITRLRLPSTSPAHAAMTVEQKLAVWRHAIIDYK
ncbi:MAG: DNA-deoxyinosine glycosylase [Methylophaga sp.]|nr:DNA-deoxyinosine glycosylase [Methylophaga sp.]